MITLQLNSEIFSEKNIKYTQKVYSRLAKIRIEFSSNYWILQFSDCIYEERLTIKEFENYLIGLENSK
ncbi:HxsD-like protein [Sporofaciens sp. SGI.106]|uniref:HxsD-like protein n=1 Tax=Sporofaciens sp. SGI.106 TaxID=3420568 RepID=UPI003CFE34F9